MHRDFTDEGIVLNKYHMSEKTEVIELLSAESGHIQVAFNGGKDHFLQPFSEIKGLFSKGRRELLHLSQISIIRQWHFEEDYDCFCWASYFLELFNKVACQADGPEEYEAFYQLLADTLDNLQIYNNKGVAISVWSLLRIIKLLGIEPELDRCGYCGKDDIKYFDGILACAVCESCRKYSQEYQRIINGVFELICTFKKLNLSEAMTRKYIAKVYAGAELLLIDHLQDYGHVNLKTRRFLKIGDKNIESFRN